MGTKWLVTIGGSCVGAFVTWQALFSAEVSELGMFLKLVLYAAQAALVAAVDRPRTKATN